MVILHRSSFVEWQPSAIVGLASSGDGSLVMAARENGDIELYETNDYHCFQVINNPVMPPTRLPPEYV